MDNIWLNINLSLCLIITFIYLAQRQYVMVYDIIVVGAGPAGLTAGANAANRGLKTIIIEGQGIAGGQPATFYPKKRIIDHPGFPKGVTGRELSKRLYEQAVHSGSEIKLNEPIVTMKLDSDVKILKSRRKTYKGKRVILATGLHNIPRHHPNLPDSAKNVHHFVKEPKKFRNRTVLVIGGGDTAFDRAIMIAGHAKKTMIAVRESYTKAKVSSVKRAADMGVEVFFDCDVLGLDKKKVLLSCQKKEMVVDDIVVSIGFVPSLEIINNTGLKKNRHGIIKVDDRMRTSIPGVFAAGDLVSDVKLIATACSGGIIAAISTFESIKKPYWLK